MGVLYYIVGILVLVAILKIITLPFKIIIKFIINSVIGGLILGILGFFGIIVIANWWVILLTGLFGVPGLVIAIIISLFL